MVGVPEVPVLVVLLLACAATPPKGPVMPDTASGTTPVTDSATPPSSEPIGPGYAVSEAWSTPLRQTAHVSVVQHADGWLVIGTAAEGVETQVFDADGAPATDPVKPTPTRLRLARIAAVDAGFVVAGTDLGGGSHVTAVGPGGAPLAPEVAVGDCCYTEVAGVAAWPDGRALFATTANNRGDLYTVSPDLRVAHLRELGADHAGLVASGDYALGATSDGERTTVFLDDVEGRTVTSLEVAGSLRALASSEDAVAVVTQEEWTLHVTTAAPMLAEPVTASVDTRGLVQAAAATVDGDVVVVFADADGVHVLVVRGHRVVLVEAAERWTIRSAHDGHLAVAVEGSGDRLRVVLAYRTAAETGELVAVDLAAIAG